jgi:hypothetical protein
LLGISKVVPNLRLKSWDDGWALTLSGTIIHSQSSNNEFTTLLDLEDECGFLVYRNAAVTE